MAVEPLTFGQMEVALNKANHGQTVTVSLGDELVLTLEENATTGYLWTPEGRRLPPGLREVADNFLPPEGGGIGAGGRRQIRLRAVAPGGGKLVFRLRRSWEPPDQDLGTFAVQVVIKG
jgi:predicted secreted protein